MGAIARPAMVSEEFRLLSPCMVSISAAVALSCTYPLGCLGVVNAVATWHELDWFFGPLVCLMPLLWYVLLVAANM